MNGRFIRSSVIVLALAIAGGAWAYAQAPGVNVKFPFVAAGKTLDAGTYTVDVAENGNVVLAAEGGTSVEFADTKKLNDRKFDRPELMFDVVGSARIAARSAADAGRERQRRHGAIRAGSGNVADRHRRS